MSAMHATDSSRRCLYNTANTFQQPQYQYYTGGPRALCTNLSPRRNSLVPGRW